MFKIFARGAHKKLIAKGFMAIVLTVGFTPSGIAQPSQVHESGVENCDFLGKVEGSSGYGKNFGWQPIAKSSALKKAEKLGASHVVWQRMVPVGAFNGYAIARAYNCNS
jgi:hypothetical protein